MTSRVSPKLCGLRANATGVRELCPGADCVFWEDGGSIVEAGCAIERLGVPIEQPGIAQHLLELRLAAAEARDESERRDAYRRFSELLNLNRE